MKNLCSQNRDPPSDYKKKALVCILCTSAKSSCSSPCIYLGRLLEWSWLSKPVLTIKRGHSWFCSFFIVIHEGAVPVFLKSHSLNVSPLLVLFKMRISECTLALNLSMSVLFFLSCLVFHYNYYSIFFFKENYLRKQYCPPKRETDSPRALQLYLNWIFIKIYKCIPAMQCWRTINVPRYTMRI